MADLSSTRVFGDLFITNDAEVVGQLTVGSIASPSLTGTPTSPTAAANTNTTQIATTAFVIGQAGTATPLMAGTAAVGSATRFAREDHRHPIDSSRAPTSHATNGSTYGYASSTNAGHVRIGTGIGISSGTISVSYGTAAGTACQGNDARLSDARTPVSHASTGTGYGVASGTNYGHVKIGSGIAVSSGTISIASGASLPGIPTAATAAADTNTTQIATCAFVIGQASAVAPLMAGTAAIGTSTRFARADHVHPVDTSRAAASHTHAGGDVTSAVANATAAVTATKLATARTISLTGDVTGSVSFDGSANVSIAATVADDSHAHVISNVDGLQAALDAKLATTGKAADADKLDGVNGASYVRSDADDTITGDINFNGSALSYDGSNAVHVAFPAGATYSTTTTTVTGAIKITLPVSWTSTMMRMTVHVYEYTANESFTLLCGGYNYVDTPGWTNTFAQIIGKLSGVDYTVRFGHDGTKCCIYIGEVASTWSYPQVVVTDFYAGYSNATSANWADGWSIGFATTLGTITSTHSDNFPRASQANILSTSRTISLTGAVTGSASFNGSANAAIATTIASNASLGGVPTATTAAVDTNTTQVATCAFVIGQAASTAPVMDGTATVGTSLRYARADHVHPTDTSRAASSHNHSASNITSGTLAVARGGTGIASYTTGNYIRASGATTIEQRTPAQVRGDIGAAPTAHASTATTYGVASATNYGHVKIGTGIAVSTGTISIASSANLPGAPTAATAAADTNTTQIATTAFVIGQASAATPLMDGTAAIGTSLRYARADHVHPVDTSRAAASHSHSYLPLSGGTMTGNITFGIPISSTSSKILWSGLTDIHSIFVEETTGSETTHLVIQSEDNGDDDHVIFRSKNSSTVVDVLAIKHTRIDASVPIYGSLSGNASTATKLATARTISLTGDVTGSASFDGSANASITATVADDSHNHVVSNVDGLQTALDAKLALAGGSMTGSVLYSGDQDYKGIYWGAKYEDASAHSDSWAYIRQGTSAGQLEIGSDDAIVFYETDGRTLAGTLSCNSGTLNMTSGLSVGGVNVCLTNDSRLTNARTPTSHASTGTGYGVASGTNYGHVKIGTGIAVSSGTISIASSANLPGAPTAATAAADTNTTQIATTGFVIGQASSTNPVMNGTVAVGTSLRYARADHVHPVDTSRAPTSHASTGTGYGVATTSNYGHVKVGSGIAVSSGTISIASGATLPGAPGISDFTNANHTHVGASTGGTIDHGALTGRGDDDHTIYVLASGSRAFTGVVSGVTPTSGAHLATKAYVDSLVTGMSWKNGVRAATTANGALTTAFANAQVIDGVTLTTGDRILLKNQTTGSENGIYTVNATGAPTRAADADAASDLVGAAVFVREGTTNGDTGWVCTNDAITLGTTALTFAQFSGSGTYVAGTGLSLSGKTFSINTATTVDLSTSQTLSNKTLSSPALTGTPTAPTASVGTNTTQIATTAFVIGQAGTATPVMDGTAAVGTATRFAREDHKHPTDTSRAPTSHASTGTGYGVASGTNYGHVKIGTGIGVSSGTISVSYGTAAGTACQGNDARLSDARTPVSHTHGGGDVTSTVATAAQTIATVTGTGTKELVRGNMADNDYFRILIGGTASNAGYVELATADDGTEPVYVRQYTGTFTTLTRTATLLDGSGNTSFPGTVTAPTFSGALSGNASTATKLATARTLSVSGAVTGSASFDGSGNAAIATSLASNLNFPGAPTVATAAADTTTTQIATTAFVIGQASSSNPAMNGTVAIGTSKRYARADHVHPVDTSRAPTSHASSATTYGVATTSNYGHVKIGSNLAVSSGTVSLAANIAPTTVTVGGGFKMEYNATEHSLDFVFVG